MGGKGREWREKRDRKEGYGAYNSGAVKSISETRNLFPVALTVTLQTVNALAQHRDLRLQVDDGSVLVLERLLVLVAVSTCIGKSTKKQ